LSKISYNRENPMIRDLVEERARVVYFWQVQQVLCIDLSECKATPGWLRSEPTEAALPFGPGMAPGERARRMPESANDTVIIEPLCLVPQLSEQPSLDPHDTITSIRLWRLSRGRMFAEQRPSCYPPDQAANSAMLGLVHQTGAFLRPTATNIRELQTPASSSNVSYSAAVRIAAERLNVLMVLNFMEEWSKMRYITKNPLFAMDYVHPVFVQRLVEINQQLDKCGIDFQCTEIGRCSAKSYMKYEGTAATCPAAHLQSVLGRQFFNESATSYGTHQESGRNSNVDKYIFAACLTTPIVLIIVFCIFMRISHYGLPMYIRNQKFVGIVCWRKQGIVKFKLMLDENEPDERQLESDKENIKDQVLVDEGEAVMPTETVIVARRNRRNRQELAPVDEDDAVMPTETVTVRKK